MNNNRFLTDLFGQKPKQKKIEVRLNANKIELDLSLEENDYLGDCACSMPKNFNQHSNLNHNGNKNKPKIFISYAKEDKEKIQILFRKLREAGFDPWLDSEKILPGESWELEITKALRTASYTIICFSNISVNKTGFFQEEIKIALKAQKQRPEGRVFIIPLRLEECDLPASLEGIQYVDFFRDDWLSKIWSLLKEEANNLKDKRIIEENNTLPKDTMTNKIEFINRVHELDEIRNPGGPKLIGIDAPLGFGKSRLLREVKNWYSSVKKDDWICILINLNQRIDDYSKTPLLILDSISEQFMEKATKIRDPQEIIGHLINKNKNIILLFDAIECNPQAVKYLQDNFISTLMIALRRTNLICRIIFAGRYIQNPRRYWRGKYIEWDWSNYKIVKLTPLDSQIVRHSIMSELRNYPLKDLEKEILTEEIESLSGGHPGIIEKMLYNPPHGSWALAFYENQLSFEIKKELFQSCARPVIDHILREIDDKNLREVLKVLTIFRRFHFNTIRALQRITNKKIYEVNLKDKIKAIINNLEINKFLEPFSKVMDDALIILTNLVNSGLVNAPTLEKQFYHDAIIRKLILVQLQIEENSGRYLKLHALAHAIYETWIENKNVDGRELSLPLADNLQADFIAENFYHLLNCLNKDQRSQNEKLIKAKIRSYIKILRSSFETPKNILQDNLKSILKQDEDIPGLLKELLGEDGANRMFDLLG